MKTKTPQLLIKNMVCPRCITTVEAILRSQKIGYSNVILGEVALKNSLSVLQRNKLDLALKQAGFELIETRLNATIEKIKHLILQYIQNLNTGRNKKLSSYITDQIPNDYSYLSDLFSSVEGITIEHYFICQRIEKVKEMLVYAQLSLSEIAYQTGFSSVHHLSAQFKKTTGLTPTHFKKIGAKKRKSISG